MIYVRVCACVYGLVEVVNGSVELTAGKNHSYSIGRLADCQVSLTIIEICVAYIADMISIFNIFADS